MANFQYRALRVDGGVAEGQIDAPGRLDASRRLQEQGLRPLRLAEVQGQAASSAGRSKEGLLPWKRDHVSFAQLEDFTRSLASLLSAGVPLSRALTILYKETTHPAAAAKWKELHDLVVDGISLADAMRRFPGVFPKVYVAMVESGEAGGFLDLVLAQIADFQAREKELRGKVISAMIYPVMLLLLAVGVLIFLMVYFIPRFQTLFAGFDADLPLLTQVIVATSDLMRDYGLLFAVGAGALIWAGVVWSRREPNRLKLERWLLLAPVIGPLAAKIAMARFCRMLGTLLGAGVTLVSALGVARRSLGYQTLIDLVADATERVRKGETLAGGLAQCRSIFRGSTLEMIGVAEESGRLDQELVRLASVQESELDRELKGAVSMAEPILLFVIAAFIGLIFIGMVIPIFTIQDYIQ